MTVEELQIVNYCHRSCNPLKNIYGNFTMLTKDMLLRTIEGYNGTIEEILRDIANQHGYIEVQVWNDDCLNKL